MNIELHKVTWYSKLLAVILFVLTFYVGFKLGIEKASIEEAQPEIQTNPAIKKVEPILINSTDIKEDNFTGTVSTITGSSLLATKSAEYVNKTVQEFRYQANNDVPDMRKQFGEDNPTSNYTINIEAKYLKNTKTESIVISTYTYTGGAHGSSSYKVFTLSIKDQKILSISDILKKEGKIPFVGLVKKELNAWNPDDNGVSPVFPDVVKDLTLDDFSEWSIDDQNLIIYFSQYAIGPGVLGQVAFPISVNEIDNFLIPELY